MEEPTLCSPEPCSMNYDDGSEFSKNCDVKCLDDKDSTVAEGEVSEAVKSEGGKAENLRSILKFHSIHGKNIELEGGGRRVVRTEGCFDNGLVFSDRPISIEEHVIIRLTDFCNDLFSGGFQFGVTNIDPASFNSDELPVDAWLFMDERGFWINYLHEKYSKEDNLLQFKVTSTGDIIFSINEDNKGVFIRGVDTTRPLWVIADLWKAARAIEFESDSQLDAGTVHSLEQPSINFHHMHGKNIMLERNCRRAVKTDGYDYGIVFSNRPIAIDEHVSIRQINSVCEDSLGGGFLFGVTTVDPASMKSDELPNDCWRFAYERGFWINLLPAKYTVNNTLLQFKVTTNGDIIFSVNGENQGIIPRHPRHTSLFHGIDTTRPLWVIADINEASAIEFEADSPPEEGAVHSLEQLNPSIEDISFLDDFDWSKCECNNCLGVQYSYAPEESESEMSSDSDLCKKCHVICLCDSENSESEDSAVEC